MNYICPVLYEHMGSQHTNKWFNHTVAHKISHIVKKNSIKERVECKVVHFLRFKRTFKKVMSQNIAHHSMLGLIFVIFCHLLGHFANPSLIVNADGNKINQYSVGVLINFLIHPLSSTKHKYNNGIEGSL